MSVLPLSFVSQPEVPAPATLKRLATTFASRAAAHDRDASFAFENFRDLESAGVLRLTVASEFGGAGGGLSDASQVLSAIAWGDASTGLVLAMHYIQHGLLARKRHWPSPLRALVARSAISEGGLINQVRVEPELGSPTRGGEAGTIAERVPQGWRINGHKRYATGSEGLAWFVVWARTPDNAQVGMWLVPGNALGVRIEKTWDHLGMRGSSSHDVIFRDVIVPAEYAVDLKAPADAQKSDLHHSAWFTCALNAVYVGVAEAARDFLVSYVQERAPTSLGAPLSTLPRIREQLGRMDILVRSARRLQESITAEYDAAPGSVSIAELGAVKQVISDQTIEAVKIAIETIGNPGLSRSHPLERHFRDVQCSRIHTPQLDASALAAARERLDA
ncbi:acyl-CoA dehydrogenase family protein [Aquabacter sp. CN5-332]|uniref:acyl-CoA dehydrogenase family protein n=1 Tax=Aquabacter sp. CN5-332 TaxID=3156608 RepID=UPI0032B34CD9